MQLSPHAHLRNAHALIANATASLEHCIKVVSDPRTGDTITPEFATRTVLEQQGDWVIGELEHAIAQIRSAKARVAEKLLRAEAKRSAVL